MTVSERQRHDLMGAVEEMLGEAHAETLMNLLPPVGWADVATKHDLDQQRLLLKADIDQLRTELKGDIDQVRTEVKGDISQLRADAKADLEAALRQQLVAFLSASAVMLAIVAAIVQLAG